MNNIRKKLLPTEGKPLLDIAILGIIAAVMFLFPFVQYNYKKEIYSIAGTVFFTGTKVKGGTVAVPFTMIVVLTFIAIIAAIVIAVIFPVLKNIKVASYLLAFTGILMVGTVLFFKMQSKFFLKELKNFTMGYAIWVVAVIGFLIVIRALYTLYQNKKISVLDFMIMPGCLYLLVNNYMPLLGIFIAFKKIDYSVRNRNSDSDGLSKFKYLFASSDAWLMTRNTILSNVAFIVIGNVAAIFVAILLNDLVFSRLKKFYQTAILLPQLISIIIISYVVYAFLSNEAGLITRALAESGTINFYQEPFYWPFILIFINVWKGLGYSTIIYLSSIVGIDRSLYEAAAIDGCNKINQIFKVTLPSLKPTIITLVILSVGRIFFSDFGLFYQVPMNSGALFSVTQTIDTYVYRSLLQLNNISMSSAASVYQSIVGFVLVMATNAIVRKVDKENAMF